MSAVMQSARGASAFTSSTPPPPGLVDQIEEAPGDAHAWGDLIDELLRISLLQDDYDGEGSTPPLPGLVHGAITLAQVLKLRGWQPADRVVPGVNGTVYFEWYYPAEYREIEVTSPFDAKYRVVDHDSKVSTVLSISIHS